MVEIAMRRSQEVPLSLYIHFPWCVRKCPYCDFLSYPCGNSLHAEHEYIEAIIRDLEQELIYIGSGGAVKINSIYIGGGTPSLLSLTSIDKLLQKINRLCVINASAEITIEANPGTINYEYCRGLLANGITRISIGIQSLQDEKLAIIGRIHDAAAARQSVIDAQRAGFTNINLDFMFGMPQQNVTDALFDLQQALDLAPTHISWYQFTLEKGTVFYKNPPPGILDNEIIWQMEECGKELLATAGFEQYEVSAYCRDDFQCQHNLNYWQFGDYLGIGVGAHGKLTFIVDDKICDNVNNYFVTRYSKHIYPQAYCNGQQRGDFVAAEFEITKENLPGEFMLNALRLYRRIPYDLFIRRTGLPLTCIADKLQQAVDLGLLSLDSVGIVTSKKGRNFLNDLLQIFI